MPISYRFILLETSAAGLPGNYLYMNILQSVECLFEALSLVAPLDVSALPPLPLPCSSTMPTPSPCYHHIALFAHHPFHNESQKKL